MIKPITRDTANALRTRIVEFRNGFIDSTALKSVYLALLGIVGEVNCGPERRGKTVEPCTRDISVLWAVFPDGSAGRPLVAQLAEQMGAFVEVMETRHGKLTADALARTTAAVDILETLDTIVDQLMNHPLVRRNALQNAQE